MSPAPTQFERNAILGLVLAILGCYGKDRGTMVLMHAALLASMAVRMDGVESFRKGVPKAKRAKVKWRKA